MTPRGMTARQFDWTLRMRGAAISAWPAPERAGALALLAVDAACRDRLALALSRDDGADDDVDGGADSAGACGCEALDRIRARLQAQLSFQAVATPALRWGMRGSALAACLVAGLWAGGALDNEHDPLSTVQVAALEALQ